eukprot:TRINITY_DN18650_c0_g1_i1.p1 TRINITY_DN18650_c0_g1~~TRINITY_DN18650_c0_g1_i1.p1  ORF type:complete len:467 (+),score=48.16 TRINITY_DN18650_c0_g1_i1:34-1434(+)
MVASARHHLGIALCRLIPLTVVRCSRLSEDVSLHAWSNQPPTGGLLAPLAAGNDSRYHSAPLPPTGDLGQDDFHGSALICKSVRDEAARDLGSLLSSGGNATRLGTHTEDVRALLTSFLNWNKCVSLDGGVASRSGAKLMMSPDSKWVVKVVKPAEFGLLWNLLEFDKTWTYENGTWLNWKCMLEKRDPDRCSVSHNPYTNRYRKHIESATSLILPLKMMVKSQNIVVMPNVDLEVRRVLKELGSTAVVKKFDAKPIQVSTSAQRPALLRELLTLGWAPAHDGSLVCGRVSLEWFRATNQYESKGFSRRAEKHGNSCWMQLQRALVADTNLLDNFLGRKLVDYSLLVHLAQIEFKTLPANFELPVGCILSTQLQGQAILMCVSIIDYLMERTVLRWMESWTKDKKFHGYAIGVRNLLKCVGDPSLEDCNEYLAEACEPDPNMSPWCVLVAARARQALQLIVSEGVF